MVVTNNFFHLITDHLDFAGPVSRFALLTFVLCEIGLRHGYQCKPPNDNILAKAVGSHVCRHEEAQEKPTAGQGETMAGQQGGGNRSARWGRLIAHCLMIVMDGAVWGSDGRSSQLPR